MEISGLHAIMHKALFILETPSHDTENQHHCVIIYNSINPVNMYVPLVQATERTFKCKSHTKGRTKC